MKPSFQSSTDKPGTLSVTVSNSSDVFPEIGSQIGHSKSLSTSNIDPLMLDPVAPPRKRRKARRKSSLSTPKITNWLMKCPSPCPPPSNPIGDPVEPTKPKKQRRRRRKTLLSNPSLPDQAPLSDQALCLSPVKPEASQSRTSSMSPHLRPSSRCSMGPSSALSKPNGPMNGSDVLEQGQAQM